jgi:phage recombination protein Bet
MKENLPALPASDAELISVLRASHYPGASAQSVALVLSYCRAAQLDPMQKPVHIVPMWDSKAGEMRDVVMPGIGLYRVQAARTGQCAGISEPEFGPEETRELGGVKVTFPLWCKVTVRRKLADGTIAEFTAVERWLENYAIKGGKEKSIAPNAMWMKRGYGQIAKCTEAQALRKAFPEIGSSPTAEEMEGKPLDPNTIDAAPAAEAVPEIPAARREILAAAIANCAALEDLAALWGDMSKDERRVMAAEKEAAKVRIAEAA